MKKIISALSAVLALTVISTNAFADSNPITCKDFPDFCDTNEFSQVIEQNANNFYMKDIGYTGAVPASENVTLSEYKEYSVSFKFLEGLSKGTPIEELLPDDYAWMIPSGNSLAKAVLKDGAWKVIGYSYATPEQIANNEADDDSIRIDKINSAIETITSNGSVIKDVVCVKVVGYFSTFVCIVSDETYLIPFCSRPDFTGLINGKLYSASDVYETLLHTMGNGESSHNAEIINGRDLSELTDEEFMMLEFGGGGSVKQNVVQDVEIQQNAEIPFLPIILIPAAAIAITITILLLVWNRRKAPKNK